MSMTFQIASINSLRLLAKDGKWAVNPDFRTIFRGITSSAPQPLDVVEEDGLYLTEICRHGPCMMFNFLRRVPEAPLSENSKVCATSKIVDHHRVAPQGSTGTVLRIYGDGVAYEVEFTSPHRVVVFATRKQLGPA